MDPSSDGELVARVRAGDLAAYDLLVERHCRRLRAFIALRAPVPHLIDEIAHEALVLAYRRLDDLVDDGFGPWVLAIAGQLLRAERQRFARQQRHLANLAREQEADQDPEPREDLRDVDHLERCLASLPPNLRALIDLKYAEARPAEEIATRLGRSVAWVGTTLFRLRARLRECIEARRTAEGR